MRQQKYPWHRNALAERIGPIEDRDLAEAWKTIAKLRKRNNDAEGAVRASAAAVHYREKDAA